MKKIISSALLFSTLFVLGCEKDTTYNAFAQCLEESGAQFYGAFWCPNCSNQKEMFGDSADLLPYVECAQGGKNAEVQRCLDEKVLSYPTWKFKDGSILTGTQSIETLAEYSACPLPGEEVNSVLLQPASE